MRKVLVMVGQAVTVVLAATLTVFTFALVVGLATGEVRTYHGTNAGVYVDMGTGRCVGWEVRGHPGPFGSVTHASDVCS